MLRQMRLATTNGYEPALDLNLFSSPYGGSTPPSYQPAPYPPPVGGPIPGAEKKIPAAICGILLGGFGVHKFILGYTVEGLIMLGITVLTCGLGSLISGIIGLVEGIMYLTKSDRSSWRPISRDAAAGFEGLCWNLLMPRQP